MQIESRIETAHALSFRRAATADPPGDKQRAPPTLPCMSPTQPRFPSIRPVHRRLLHRSAIAGAITLLVMSATLRAQTAAPAAKPAATEEEALWMSPFVVTTQQDTGYAATNTLAGTRLNTAIANTPVALSVMTREFLNDIGAIDGNRAIEYALNADNNTSDATGNSVTMNAFNYRVRGFSGTTVARNYFNSSFLTDTYNVDSMEVARGPNSVLFGIASPAGVFNSTIKIARPGQTVTSLQLRVGSFDEYRGSIDLARTFGARKNLAVRLNLLEHNSNGFYEFEKTQRRAATLAGTWRPFKATTVRVELERARLFVAPARPFPVTDGYTAWIQAGSLLHTVANQFSSVTTNPMLPAGGGRVVYFPDSTLGTQPVAYSGNYFRTTRNVPIRGGTASDFDGIFDQSIVPRDANLLGPNNGNTSNQEVIGVFVEQRVGRQLAFEAAFYRQGRNYLNRQPEAFNDNALYLMISTNDPVFDPVTGAQTGYGPAKNVGRYITRSSYQEAQNFAHNDNFRLTVSYDLNLSQASGWLRWLGRHQFAGLLQHTASQSENVTRLEMNVAPDRQFIDLTNTSNAITRVSLIDFSSSDPKLHSIMDARQNPVKGRLLGVPGVNVQSGLANIAWNGSRSTVDSAIFATQSSFFKERLWVTGGIRHDTVLNNAATAVRDTITREYLGVLYNQPDAPKVKDTTNSFGATFHVTPWLSVFANQSDNFAVQASSLIFAETGSNTFSGNTKGKGRDVGLRSKLFDGKVNLSFGFYKTSQGGQYYAVSGTYASVSRIIWDALGQARPLLVGGDLQDINAQGLEFELTANPIKNLRLSFNYSRTNSYGQDRPLNNVMAYLNQAKAVWLTPGNAARPTPNTTYGATIQENWNYIQQQYDTDTLTNGRMPFAFRPESANVFARYQFSAGALKGFAIGGGVNWRGPFVLGYRNNDSSQQVRGYEQIYINGMLSYECRLFGRVPATFQLNGDNLLGFDDRYPRRYYWFDDAQGPSRMYQYPYLVRRYSLTTTLRF